MYNSKKNQGDITIVKQHIKTHIVILTLFTITASGDIDLQKGIYDAAEEMMEFDEKMNRMIAKHNGVDYEEDSSSDIIDFEEREHSYVLERNIKDNKNTQIEINLKDGVLNIDITVRKQEKVEENGEISYETTLTKSTIPLYLPQDADENTLQESYENGILKVTFRKKSQTKITNIRKIIND